VFGDRQISIKAVTQHESPFAATEGSAMVVVLTDVAQEGQMRAALEEIARLEVVREKAGGDSGGRGARRVQTMKFAVVLPDGAADEPIRTLTVRPPSKRRRFPT